MIYKFDFRLIVNTLGSATFFEIFNITTTTSCNIYTMKYSKQQHKVHFLTNIFFYVRRKSFSRILSINVRDM